MNKRRLFGAILALLLFMGSIPSIGQAEAMPDYISYVRARNGDGTYRITGFCIAWSNVEPGEVSDSDIADLRFAYNGTPISVDYYFASTDDWENDNGDTTYYYNYRYSEPFTNPGIYELSLFFRGESYTASKTEIIDPENAPLGSALNPIKIANEAELRAFADEVNNTPLDYSHMTYQYAELTSDIALTQEWTPIGRFEIIDGQYIEYAFSGYLNGGGYTISNIKIGTPSNPCTLENVGFISKIMCEVSNLNLEVEIYAHCPEEQVQVIGGLAGGGVKGVDKCSVSGSISATGSLYATPMVGGILGMQGSNVINCSSSVDIVVNNASRAGGIVGDIRNTRLQEIGDKLYLMPGEARIESCTFDGTITDNTKDAVLGGIAGSIGAGAEISSCSSVGMISGGFTSGGLVGSASTCIIRDSYATGYVSGENSGGLIGAISYAYIGELEYRLSDRYAGSGVFNCYATGDVSGEQAGGFIGNINWVEDDFFAIDSCHATGNVSGAGAAGFVFSANIMDGIMTNCYATGNVAATHSASGFAQRFDSQRAYFDGITIGGGDSPFGKMTVAKCYASGNVTALVGDEAKNDKTIASGFIGSCNASVTDCIAVGNVTAGTYAYGFGSSSGYDFLGAEEYDIERCSAHGDVYLTGGEDAIAAYAFGECHSTTVFANCYATGNVYSDGRATAFSSAVNSYYTGTLKGEDGSYVYFSVANSYGDMTVDSEAYAEVPIGKTTAEMQSPEFVALLNAGQNPPVWFANEGGYPVHEVKLSDITGAGI